MVKLNKHRKMTVEQEAILLIKYEKIKGYSSELFCCEDWAEFRAFCKGYLLAQKEYDNFVNNKTQ